ncbi:hypothetical protein [Marinilactibacillus psychrotolerans]|uniref:Uncharacterized protein n=1 Tax=Marinilactibacillus psychrotolerans TaxID=191770 RepID=A0AAV3WS71_9LACT|nr:hypothetical protein [Marinilactibacillus psychrotolerans]GEL67261.1 hypothetical protein MPS01_14160 [Marinilactibacillus psychrotolerans]GEQ36065.1 hypothetical protein M132T_15730 [Marinilactibacillus psychrotolerans]SDC62129.1 hypothetical protein SAMN04488013_10776 [Marinilactibacillus psychrotolerans]
MKYNQLIIILKKWDALAVSLFSIYFGFIMFLNPQFINTYELYDLIGKIFSNGVFATLFIISASSKILSIFYNLKNLRVISISMLTGLWALFGTGFLMSPVSNTLYAYCYLIVILCFGIALKELLD